MNLKTKWDFLLHVLEIALLQIQVMGMLPVCMELFPMITAAFSRKMSSIFMYRMYQVILPTHILLCQTFHLFFSWQNTEVVCCQHLCSWNGDPFVFRLGWDFFLLGKDTHTILCLCLGLLSPAKAAERSRSASQATDQRGHRASAALVPVVGTTFNLPALALH